MKVRTSNTIGEGVAANTKSPQKQPWGNLNTNYTLGIDKDNHTTDYQSRF